MKKILIAVILVAVILVTIGLVTAGNLLGTGDVTGVNNNKCNCISDGQSNCNCDGRCNCTYSGQCNTRQCCNQNINGKFLQNSNSIGCCKRN